MFATNLTVLSYHKFGEEKSDYVFSRTYDELINDLKTKTFDWVTIDDGSRCMIKACEIMREMNIRAKLFISTALIGQSGYGLPGTANKEIYQKYCNWDEIKELAKYHDIENHSHEHIRLDLTDPKTVHDNMQWANDRILLHTGKTPRFFVPPWNKMNSTILGSCNRLGLTLVHSRIDIKNDTE